MHPLAIVLVVTAAICHAVWNLYAKRAADGGAVFVWLNSTVSVLLYLPVGVTVCLLYPPEWSPLLPAAMLLTGVLHTGYAVALQRGYRHGDMSVVYPLARGTGPALSVAFAIVVFAERPGLAGLLGAAGVVAGILVIGLGRADTGMRLGAGVGYGLLTGALIAAYTVWDAFAVSALGISPILLHWGDNLTRSATLAPHALRNKPEIRRVWTTHRTPILVVAVFAPAAYILVLFAYRYAPVSLVAPARELSIVIGGVLAWLLLREPQATRRILGAMVVLLGVVALATAK